MAKWFYFIDGHQFGPVESAALKQLAISGRLKTADKVRREDMADWYEAKQVTGFFSPSQSQSSYSDKSNRQASNEDRAGGFIPPPPESVTSASKWTGYRQVASDLLTYSRKDSFWEWYSRGIGQQSVLIQGLLWVFYGFVWIPIYWAVTRKQSPRARPSAGMLQSSCPHCGTVIDSRDISCRRRMSLLRAKNHVAAGHTKRPCLC
jgi:GYF domain 2